MTTTHDNLIVITGGPGAGKTTLVDLLCDAGYAVAPEAGRGIIKDQVAIGGAGTHGADANLFAELMLSWEMRSYHWAVEQGAPVFFDHALPGLAGYYRLIGQQVPPHVDKAIRTFPYHSRVFIAPPWPEIYRHDEERKQDFDEAIRTYDRLVEAYQRYGYRLVELPRTDPAGRAEFVLRHLAER